MGFNSAFKGLERNKAIILTFHAFATSSLTRTERETQLCKNTYFQNLCMILHLSLVIIQCLYVAIVNIAIVNIADQQYIYYTAGNGIFSQ